MTIDLAFAILKAVIPHVQHQMLADLTLAERVRCVLDAVREVAALTPSDLDDQASRFLDQLQDAGVFDWVLALIAKRLAGVQVTELDAVPMHEGFSAAIDPEQILKWVTLIVQILQLFMEPKE